MNSLRLIIAILAVSSIAGCSSQSIIDNELNTESVNSRAIPKVSPGLFQTDTLKPDTINTRISDTTEAKAFSDRMAVFLTKKLQSLPGSTSDNGNQITFSTGSNGRYNIPADQCSSGTSTFTQSSRTMLRKTTDDKAAGIYGKRDYRFGHYKNCDINGSYFAGSLQEFNAGASDFVASPIVGGTLAVSADWFGLSAQVHPVSQSDPIKISLTLNNFSRLETPEKYLKQSGSLLTTYPRAGEISPWRFSADDYAVIRADGENFVSARLSSYEANIEQSECGLFGNQKQKKINFNGFVSLGSAADNSNWLGGYVQGSVTTQGSGGCDNGLWGEMKIATYGKTGGSSYNVIFKGTSTEVAQHLSRPNLFENIQSSHF